MPPYASRRSFLLGGAGIAAALGLAACGSSSSSGSGKKDGNGTAASTGSASAPAAAAAFPVSIADKYGTTTIAKQPKRIVCDGYTDQDAVLALGVVPVGIRQWIPEWKQGVGSWATAKLQGQSPKIWADNSVPFEKIVALQPDVVFEINSGLTQSDYTKLSKIAPTVAQAKGYLDYGTPWDVQSLMVGEALGRKADMQKLVDGVKAQIAAAAKAHPGFAGKSVNIMSYSGDGTYSAYANEDTRVRFFESLGFKVPAEIDKLAGKQFYTDISRERVDLLDADLLVLLAYGSTATRANFEKDELLQGLKAVKEGRYIFVDDLDQGMAVSAATVLSLPYAVQTLVPQVAAALKA